MYIIELIAKKILKKTDKKELEESIPDFEQGQDVLQTCEEHVFLPVDSTGEVLSCINCGFVVHKSDLNKVNPF